MLALTLIRNICRSFVFCSSILVGNEAAAQMLLAKGASIKAKNEKGETPRQVARRKSKTFAFYMFCIKRIKIYVLI